MIKSETRERRAFALLLSALLILTQAMPARAAGDEFPGHVRSRVTIARSGEPVEGATISLINIATAQTVAREVTSEDGSADFSQLPLGTYQVSLKAPEGLVGVASPLFNLDAESSSVEVKMALQQDVSEHDEIRMAAGGILPWILIGLAAAGVAAVVIERTEDGSG